MNILTEKHVREAIFNGSIYASYDGSRYYANGINMQAIADELNATLGSGECELIHVMNEYDHSIPEWDHDECSKCGCWIDEDVNFCPNCGRTVKR